MLHFSRSSYSTVNHGNIMEIDGHLIPHVSHFPASSMYAFVSFLRAYCIFRPLKPFDFKRWHEETLLQIVWNWRQVVPAYSAPQSTTGTLSWPFSSCTLSSQRLIFRVISQQGIVIAALLGVWRTVEPARFWNGASALRMSRDVGPRGFILGRGFSPRAPIARAFVGLCFVYMCHSSCILSP